MGLRPKQPGLSFCATLCSLDQEHSLFLESSVTHSVIMSEPRSPVFVSNQDQHSFSICQKPTLAHNFLRDQPQDSTQNLWLATT